MERDNEAMVAALARHGQRAQLDAFLAQGAGCGWCRHPIRLKGSVVSSVDGKRALTFTSGSLPDGVLLKACGSRSEIRCPSCAAIYRGDSRHLVRAGLEGGKGVDQGVAAHPAVFLTLSAPGFGVVHTAHGPTLCHRSVHGSRCSHGRLLNCRLHHDRGDDLVGTPLCPDCYDYQGAVLHNAATPELWRRTMIYTQRQLALVLGWTQADTARAVRLAFCRVAEFQRRGVVHLHAVVRADGIDGALPPVDATQLADACRLAASSVSVAYRGGLAKWGRQIDVQMLGGADEDRARRLASYVAKYATKNSSDEPRLDGRIRSFDDLERRELPGHLHRMVATALSLSAEPDCAKFNVARHAHQLGYGGHFLTKSRNYSTTFGALRAARVQWRVAQRPGHQEEKGSSEGRWRAVGAGWTNEGEAIFANYQQRQRAEDRKAAESAWYTRTD